jgi:adenine-specific DNA-methyltransferase
MPLLHSTDLLREVDVYRREISKALDPRRKIALGQFMTPEPVASFMAGLFKKRRSGDIRLLDAGAGMGSLTLAFLQRVLKGDFGRDHVTATAFEVDESLFKDLGKHIEQFSTSIRNSGNKFNFDGKLEDFIVFVAENNGRIQPNGFTHAILNPPYRKIHSESEHRLLLREMGIETVNLYSAFVELAIMQLADRGEMVAIIPRSFCNGPYYRRFRRFLHGNTGIASIHLFESRSKAFKDDEVLQENVILHLIKGSQLAEVIVSSSMDSTFADYHERTVGIESVFSPEDKELFLRIPPVLEGPSIPNSVHLSLVDLSLTVSTGPIVDFRVKPLLRKNASSSDIPLIYPGHFAGMRVAWPKANFRKYNAVYPDEDIKEELYPKGYYVLVRRFSSKEERRRINAAVISPVDLLGNSYAFENHLNVFHSKWRGIDEDFAWGLAAYLNSSIVDLHFRGFNGHTQVNATDLRQLKYPEENILKKIGRKMKTSRDTEQVSIDKIVGGAL